MLPFLVTEGSRVLEKMVNETLASKTVFSHLNALAALVRKILFVLLESKIHIFAPPCNILYM